MAVFLPEANLVAVETAPPKLDDMLEAAYAKAGIYFPFVDFIGDPYAAITEGLTSAFVMGKSKIVGGVETDIVAIATKDIHAQIWIGSADKLSPRLVWLNPARSVEKPRSMIEFSNWRLGAPLAAESFQSAAAAKAGKMKFAKPAGAEASAKQ